MATGDLVASRADGGPSSSPSTELPLRPNNQQQHGAAVTSQASKDEFDVVADYHRLISEDPDLTKPVAAIEALISVLRHTSTSTAMETDEILKVQVERLKAAVPNPLPIKAGADLFTKFLARSLRQQTAPPRDGSPALDSFDKIRQHLLDNSQLFAQRAKEARDRIAERGSRYVNPGDVVLTAGGSRAVRALLLRAADRHTRELGAPRFTVVYVSDVRSRQESEVAIAALRLRDIPVVEIDPGSVAHALEARNVRRVFVGAEAVTHDGGLLSRIGTYQLAQLARAAGRDLCVCAETHKFVQQIILNQRDLRRIGIDQTLLNLPSESELQEAPVTGVSGTTTPPKDVPKGSIAFRDQVDFTPPNLVSHIITEDRVTIASGAYLIMLSMFS